MLPPSERAAPQLTRGQRWGLAVAGMLVKLLARTWRMRIDNDTGLRAELAAGRPVIYVLWHGDLLPLIWQHRGEGVAILISEHRDGELIARFGLQLGMRAVRGSTTRGATRALLQMTRALEQDISVAITPDGPRGPRHHFASGALVVAHRGAAPIVAIGMHASRAWRLKSWDRFVIPKPFARVTISYSAPTLVVANDAREAAEQVPQFEQLMHACAQRAQQYAHD